MEIVKNIENGKAMLAVTGRIDTTTAPNFEKEIEVIGDVNELVIDFAGVEYISSAGLRVLLKAQKIMNSKGSMKVVNVCGEVNDVFEITGFSDILTIE